MPEAENVPWELQYHLQALNSEISKTTRRLVATLSGVGDTITPAVAFQAEGQASLTFTPVPVNNDTLSLLTRCVCFTRLIFKNKATPAQRNFLFKLPLSATEKGSLGSNLDASSKQ